MQNLFLKTPEVLLVNTGICCYFGQNSKDEQNKNTTRYEAEDKKKQKQTINDKKAYIPHRFSKNSVAGCLPAFLNTEAVTHKCIVRIGLHLWLWTWKSGSVPKRLMIPVCVSGLVCIKLGDSEQEQQMCKWGKRRQRKTVRYTRCSENERHRSELSLAFIPFNVKVIFKKASLYRHRRLTSQQRLNNGA